MGALMEAIYEACEINKRVVGAAIKRTHSGLSEI